MPFYCCKCGQKLADGSMFCSNCGSRVGQTVEEKQPEPIVVDTPPAPVVEDVQPKEEVVAVVENTVEEASLEEEKYDVVLEKLGSNIIKLSAAFKQIFGEDLAQAKARVDRSGVQTLPYTLLEGVSKEKALNAKKLLCDAGATVSIKNSVGKKLTESDIKFGEEDTPEKAKKENSFKILKLIRSTIFLVCSILLVFLPLFYAATTDIDGNEIINSYSMCTIIIKTITPVLQGEFSFSVYNIGSFIGLFYVIIALTTMIPIIYNTCMLVYNDITNLVNKKSNAKFSKFSAWRNLGSFFANLVFILWLVGFANKIYVARIIIILGLYLAAAILDNVLEKKRDNI